MYLYSNNIITFLDEIICKLKTHNISFSNNGFPIFEQWMFLEDPPEPNHIIPYYNHNSIIDKHNYILCWYSTDYRLEGTISNLDKAIETCKQFKGICGFDFTVYEDDSLFLSTFISLLNQCITIYFAVHGIKIIFNARLINSSNDLSLKNMIPNQIISIGLLGFAYKKINKNVCIEAVNTIIKSCEPKFVCLYGPKLKYIEELIPEHIPFNNQTGFRMLCKLYPSQYLFSQKEVV